MATAFSSVSYTSASWDQVSLDVSLRSLHGVPRYIDNSNLSPPSAIEAAILFPPLFGFDSVRAAIPLCCWLCSADLFRFGTSFATSGMTPFLLVVPTDFLTDPEGTGSLDKRGILVAGLERCSILQFMICLDQETYFVPDRQLNHSFQSIFCRLCDGLHKGGTIEQ